AATWGRPRISIHSSAQESVVVKTRMSRDNAGHDKQGRGNSNFGRGQRHAVEVESGEGAAHGWRALVGGACGARVRTAGSEEDHRGGGASSGKSGRGVGAVRGNDGAAATAKWHGSRVTGVQARHRKREVCGGVTRRRATGAHGDAARADQQTQKGKCGGRDFNGGAGRSLRLRADPAEIRGYGLRD